MDPNIKLLRLKLFYFLLLTAQGFFGPFLPVIIRQKGFDAEVVGFVYTVLTFVTLFNKTVAATIADYFKIHRGVLLSGLLVMMISYTGIYMCPGIQDNDKSSENGATKVQHSNVYGTYEFLLLFLLMIGEIVGNTASAIMGETLCVNLLGDSPTKYGQQRLWGTIGHGLAAAIGGAIIDWYSKGSDQPDYFPVLMLSLSFIMLSLFNMYSVKFNMPQTTSGLGKVGVIFKHPPSLLILASAGMVGLTTGMISTFTFLYMEDVAKEWTTEFSHMKFLEGLLIFVQCICSEAPIFFVSGYIIRRTGYFMAYFISFVMQCLRICLFSIVANPWLFLPLGLFHGLTFGLSHASMMSFAGSINIPGAEATIQAIFNVSFYTCMGLGGSVGGRLINKLGYREAFYLMGIANGIYAFLFLAVYWIIFRISPTRDYKLLHRNHIV